MGWARGQVSFGQGVRTACREPRSPPDSTQCGLIPPIPQWRREGGQMMGGEEEEEEEEEEGREEEPMNEAPGPRAPSQSERPARPCLQTRLLASTSSWEPTELSPFFCR